MSADTQKRTIYKTITWRITASLTTFLIAWTLTGNILIGASIGYQTGDRDILIIASGTGGAIAGFFGAQAQLFLRKK